MAKVKINLNLDALKKVKEGLSKGGGDLFVGHKHLRPNVFIRLFPGHPNIADVQSFTEEGFWINSKRYVSPKTFGKPCPITEEVEEARALNNADIDKLLKSRNFTNKPVISFPIVVLEHNDGNGNSFKFTGIQQNMVKVLQCGPQLGNEIISLIINPPRGCTFEQLYAPTGYAIECTKDGTGLDTNYSAQVAMVEYAVPDELYDYDNIPDIYEMTRKKLHSDDYLRAIIRNYLYGEPMPEEENTNDDSNTPSAPSAKPVVKLLQDSIPIAGDAGETTKVPEAKEKPKRRSLMDDLRQ